jgi:peptidyl-prolyl cis-trans isomerase C
MKRLILTAAIITMIGSNSFAEDKILAKVNGKAITESDLNNAIEKLPEKYLSLRNNPKFRKEVLKTLIDQELLFQEAQKEGILSDPKVKKQIEDAKKQIIINALLEKHLKLNEVKVSDEEARAFYERNKNRFTDANGKQVPFESLKPFIIQTLKEQKRQEALMAAFNRFVKELKKKNSVEVYY